MLVDCFFVIIPCCMTASGKFPCAMFTRFCTNTVAISISVPTSKVTVSVYCPDDEDDELI
ncbi:putative uncharacterized protein [Bacteroides sp. CAG:20]|nr:putative uncharacterized protein [Bacteroides sp. CAG:20]